MATKLFTHTDYFSASLSRHADLKHLRLNKDSLIFSVYCAGVSIECMFRAYISKYTKEFDTKHDLEKLYAKSLLGSQFDIEEKEQLTIAVKRANKIWSNNLRYTSEKRMKGLIAHEYVKAGHSDKNIFMERLFSEIFEADRKSVV